MVTGGDPNAVSLAIISEGDLSTGGDASNGIFASSVRGDVQVTSRARSQPPGGRHMGSSRKRTRWARSPSTAPAILPSLTAARSSRKRNQMATSASQPRLFERADRLWRGRNGERVQGDVTIVNNGGMANRFAGLLCLYIAGGGPGRQHGRNQHRCRYPFFFRDRSRSRRAAPSRSAMMAIWQRSATPRPESLRRYRWRGGRTAAEHHDRGMRPRPSCSRRVRER